MTRTQSSSTDTPDDALVHNGYSYQNIRHGSPPLGVDHIPSGVNHYVNLGRFDNDNDYDNDNDNDNDDDNDDDDNDDGDDDVLDKQDRLTGGVHCFVTSFFWCILDLIRTCHLVRVSSCFQTCHPSGPRSKATPGSS